MFLQNKILLKPSAGTLKQQSTDRQCCSPQTHYPESSTSLFLFLNAVSLAKKQQIPITCI